MTIVFKLVSTRQFLKTCMIRIVLSEGGLVKNKFHRLAVVKFQIQINSIFWFETHRQPTSQPRDIKKNLQFHCTIAVLNLHFSAYSCLDYISFSYMSIFLVFFFLAVDSKMLLSCVGFSVSSRIEIFCPHRIQIQVVFSFKPSSDEYPVRGSSTFKEVSRFKRQLLGCWHSLAYFLFQRNNVIVSFVFFCCVQHWIAVFANDSKSVLPRDSATNEIRHLAGFFIVSFALPVRC